MIGGRSGVVIYGMVIRLKMVIFGWLPSLWDDWYGYRAHVISCHLWCSKHASYPRTSYGGEEREGLLAR